MDLRTKLTLILCAVIAVDAAGLEARPTAALAQALAVKTTPTATPTGTPVPGAAVNDRARPLPSPAKVPQTLDSLKSFIAARLARPEVARGRVGVKIASLNTGKVVYEKDADKYFMPASNMKNFTIATALEKLGPDFKFVTRVFAAAPPDASGTIKGDLRILGGGDISISTAFFGTSPTDPETYYKGIDRLVDAIAAAGVKKIDGNIVCDESLFKGFHIPPTWEWDDLQWYYGAEVSALPINDNAVDISVKPPNGKGGPCVITISPPNTLFQVINTCVSDPLIFEKTLAVNKRIDRNVLEVSGNLPLNDKGFTGSITVTHPAELFVAMLKQRLERRGITVKGVSKVRNSDGEATSTPKVITKLESVPFSEIAAKTMKPSQNLYTETILRIVGEVESARLHAQIDPLVGVCLNGCGREDSDVLGLGVVKQFLSSAGIPADAVVQHDGCGMSRHDLITPSAVVALYTYMAKQSKNAQAWRDSLSIGGVDGTLANRFKGTAAAGNIRGKTGTIDQVSALSGYMSTVAGEPVVLSIIVNDVPEGRTRTSLIDDITVAVANFDGKID